MQRLYDPLSQKYVKYGGNTHLSRVSSGVIAPEQRGDRISLQRTTYLTQTISIHNQEYLLKAVIHSKMGRYARVVYHLLPDLVTKELSTISLSNPQQIIGRMVKIFTLLDSCLYLAETERSEGRGEQSERGVEKKEGHERRGVEKGKMDSDGASMVLSLFDPVTRRVILANLGTTKAMIFDSAGQFKFQMEQHYVTNPKEKERYFSGIKYYGHLRPFEEAIVEYNRITRSLGEFVSPMKLRGGKYQGAESILSPIPDVSIVELDAGDVVLLNIPKFFRRMNETELGRRVREADHTLFGSDGEMKWMEVKG